MIWHAERHMYGPRTRLNPNRVRKLLGRVHLKHPLTMYDDWFRHISIVGYDFGAFGASAPMDILAAQRPDGPFALFLSGGVDSGLLAWLYDRPDADYYTGTVVGALRTEYEAAERLMRDGKLRGELHEVAVTHEEAYAIARVILPLFSEPMLDAAAVLAFAIARDAAARGHTLTVSGDCADHCFGVPTWGPDEIDAVEIWKGTGPSNLLGLDHLLPYYAPDLLAWGKAYITPAMRKEKKFLRDTARTLGMPETGVRGEKIGWRGHNHWLVGPAYDDMLRIVRSSQYAKMVAAYLGNETCPPGHRVFRCYSLVTWLKHNWDRPLAEGDETCRLSTGSVS